MSSQFHASEHPDFMIELMIESVEAAVVSQSEQPLQLWEEPNQEDGLGLAKSTLMMDEEARSALESVPLVPEAKPNYVQGIMAGKQAYLVTNLINHTSQTFFQSQMVWTIGRNRTTAFPLPDRQLSRRHAAILYNPDDGFYLIDLNSMNGSYVNGIRVQYRQRLEDGDYVCLGSTRFFFFVSQRRQAVEPIHEDVLARLGRSEG
jgi:pSer/pThr/pTyr-binding forkhead associated (FHA) protein